ncbi:MAG TPA: glycosyltransferase family 2 protein, partial [Gammaproteobacteria bacterium]|nr:glycosyltransferase family 2 protein [Gammaproteobacteria bacterium]
VLPGFTLERGLIVGLLLIIIGSIGACSIFWYWQQHAFGPLIPSQIMRILIPSLTFFILGVQCVFSSFFMRVLTLYRTVEVVKSS